MTRHATFTLDPDRAACGVRLSHKEGRRAAAQLTDVDCDRCALRVLRSLQEENPGVSVADLVALNTWPDRVGPRDPDGPLLAPQVNDLAERNKVTWRVERIVHHLNSTDIAYIKLRSVRAVSTDRTVVLVEWVTDFRRHRRPIPETP